MIKRIVLACFVCCTYSISIAHAECPSSTGGSGYNCSANKPQAQNNSWTDVQGLRGKRTVQDMIRAADRIDAAHIRYCYGGGHGGSQLSIRSAGSWCVNAQGKHVENNNLRGFDCSSSVSRLLQDAGFDWNTVASGSFTALQGLQGWKRVRLADAPKYSAVIYFNVGHIWMRFKSRGSWETSRSNPLSGPGWSERVEHPLSGWRAVAYLP